MTSYEPDILARGLDVIFCGLNPASSAAVAGHNFSSGSNRFWTVLHLAGFTALRLPPQDERRLLEYRCGITAVVRRPTRKAAEVSPEEFRQARLGFETRMRQYAPRSIAFLGKRALSIMIGRPDVNWGRLPTEFCRRDGLDSSQPQRSQSGLHARCPRQRLHRTSNRARSTSRNLSAALGIRRLHKLQRSGPRGDEMQCKNAKWCEATAEDASAFLILLSSSSSGTIIRSLFHCPARSAGGALLSSSRFPHPAFLIPLSSSRIPHPAFLIPHSSSRFPHRRRRRRDAEGIPACSRWLSEDTSDTTGYAPQTNHPGGVAAPPVSANFNHTRRTGPRDSVPAGACT